MTSFLGTCAVVAVKVFKKTTPNGKVTVYLGKRDFIDHLDHCDPIEGVVVVDNDYLKGRKIYGMVSTTYRFGREEDEVMGLKFSKEMVLAKDQVVPAASEKQELSPIQEKLIRKFGPNNAFPFVFKFPPNAPSSITLQPGEDDMGKPLGVEYSIKTFVADNPEDRSHKRSSVTLAIKKLQYAPATRSRRQPSSLVSKGFTFSTGKLNLEVTLDKEVYFHGEQIAANVVVSNNSRKSVRNIKVFAVQHCEVTMINGQYSKHVAGLETREGCPITPGASFTKVFYVVPLASSNKDRRGIALDGHLKDDDVNLASSTLVPEGKSPAEALGIVISYSLRVKLNCGTLGGELVTDVPFKLLHPAPGFVEKEKALKKSKSIERSRYENSCYADDDDNIVFEDFARLRMNESIDEGNLENDSLKDKYDELKKRTDTQITELEEEAAQSHKREEEYVKYIRELEQKNDDLERAQRATYTSLGEFETKLNSALERNVLLESELDEKELLKAMVQRLKDETRDLKQEIEVREKCNHHSNDHTRIVDTNKLDSESNSSPGHNPPLKSLNGLSTSRVSAANIVSELLRTVGVLESKLIVRANQRDFVTQNDSPGKDHMRESESGKQNLIKAVSLTQICS